MSECPSCPVQGMDSTTDRLRSLVRKWQSLIEAYVDVKTTDMYTLRQFAIGFTKRRNNQIRKTSYAQTAQIRQVGMCQRIGFALAVTVVTFTSEWVNGNDCIRMGGSQVSEGRLQIADCRHHADARMHTFQTLLRQKTRDVE